MLCQPSKAISTGIAERGGLASEYEVQTAQFMLPNPNAPTFTHSNLQSFSYVSKKH